MSKKFQVIVADPPWHFKDSLKMSDTPRGAEANYKLMKNSDIEALPINDYADPNGCVLALWVPGSLLQEGMNTMKSWGFNQKQTYIWVKVKKEPLQEVSAVIKKAYRNAKGIPFNAGIKDVFLNACRSFSLSKTLSFYMGRIFRQTHEICLIGTNNNKIYKKLANKSQRSVSFAENLNHSAKPDHLQESLEIMFPKTKRLELFARRHRAGWTCLGNEICNGEDIMVSLKKLI